MNNRERVAKDLDKAVFGTNDPAKIMDRFGRAYETQMAREATFGGYLRALRRRREMEVEEAAALAGVATARWKDWELNQDLPTVAELDSVIAKMCFGAEKRERLHVRLREADRIQPEEKQ